MKGLKKTIAIAMTVMIGVVFMPMVPGMQGQVKATEQETPSSAELQLEGQSVITLTVDETDISDKEYDGTTDAVVSPGTLQGVKQGDNVTIQSASAKFADKNIGVDKNVTVTYTLGGTDASNYQIEPEIITADISQKKIEVEGTKAESKFFDGNRNAAIKVGNVSGIVKGDHVTVSAKGTFEDANPGNDKQVAGEYIISGKDAGNYMKPEDLSTTASIFKTGFVAQGKSYKRSVSYSWNRVAGAVTYKVYQAKCGKKKYKCVKTTSALTFTKKKLKRRTTYKTYVVAFNGAGEKIAQTPTIHNMTKYGKKSNATAVSAKSTINIKKGKTASVNAKIKKKDSKKKLLWKHHVSAKIRYYSSDTSVATVNSKGVITGQGGGKAIIYSVAPTGVCAKTVVNNTTEPTFVLDCSCISSMYSFEYSVDGGKTYISNGERTSFSLSLYSDTVIIKSTMGGSIILTVNGEDLPSGETRSFSKKAGETQTILIGSWV